MQLIFAPIVDASSLDKIATMADRVVDFTHRTTAASAVTAVLVVAATRDYSATAIEELSKEIASLTKRLDKLCRERGHSHSRDKSGKCRSASRGSNPSYFWHHATFGENAHNYRKRSTYSATAVSKSEN